MSEEKGQEEVTAAEGGEETQAIIAQYQAAKRYRQWVMRGVVIGLLAVVGVGVYSYASYFISLYQDLKEPTTISQLQTRFERKLPELREKADQLYRRVGPKLAELAKEKAQKAEPEIRSLLQAQQEIFTQNMTRMLQEKGEALMAKIVDENQDTLQADFPELKDPAKLESMVRILVEATNEAAAEVFLTERIDQHLDIVEAMQTSLNANLPLRPATESNRELMTRLAQVAWDLLLVKTGEEGETAPAGEPVSGSAAK